MEEGMKRPIQLLSVLVLVLPTSFLMAFAQSQSPYTISGEARDASAQLLPGIKVCAVLTAGGVVNVRDRTCTETDAQGRFKIEALQPGPYQIYSEAMSEGYMPQYLPFYRNASLPIPQVTLSGDNPSASVALNVAPKSGLITGRVIDEDTDKPVQNFVVWAWQARVANAHTHHIVNGSRLGSFKLYASPVPFELRVKSEGYEDWFMVLPGTNRPGSLLVPAGSTAEFAVYLKRKNPAPVDPTKENTAMRLPSPVQLSPLDRTILDNFPRTTKLEWAPVSGALSYAFEVESCWRVRPEWRKYVPENGECFNPSPYLEKLRLNDTTYEFVFKGAQPGRWRVWAIDKDRRPGIKSPWRKFEYSK